MMLWFSINIKLLEPPSAARIAGVDSAQQSEAHQTKLSSISFAAPPEQIASQIIRTRSQRPRFLGQFPQPRWPEVRSGLGSVCSLTRTGRKD